FSVDELLWEDNLVTGIRGRDRDGTPCVERARLVVGADGFRSTVAEGVGAPSYEVMPAQTCFYFSFWSGVPSDGLELFLRAGRFSILFRTNDGLTLVGVGWRRAEFARVRADVENEFMRVIDDVPH